MTLGLCAAVLMLGWSVVGCGRSPLSPAPVQPEGPTPTFNTPQQSVAKLEIRAFTVMSGFDAGPGHFWYAPKLTLAETSGLSPARTEHFVFELLDIGVHGAVPTVVDHFDVTAGGSVTIDTDSWGGDWVYITNTRKAPRVAVTITYTDHSGRAAIVNAITEVSR